MQPSAVSGESIYDAVMPILMNAAGEWRSSADLAEALDVRKGQMDAWLKRATEEGKLERMNRPVRYRTSKES